MQLLSSFMKIPHVTGFESTMQGLVGAAFEGLGVAVGALAGGVVFKHYGGRTLFLGAGLVSCVSCLLHAGIQMFVLRHKPHVTDNDGSAQEAQEQQKFISA